MGKGCVESLIGFSLKSWGRLSRSSRAFIFRVVDSRWQNTTRKKREARDRKLKNLRKYWKRETARRWQSKKEKILTTLLGKYFLMRTTVAQIFGDKGLFWARPVIVRWLKDVMDWKNFGAVETARQNGEAPEMEKSQRLGNNSLTDDKCWENEKRNSFSKETKGGPKWVCRAISVFNSNFGFQAGDSDKNYKYSQSKSNNWDLLRWKRISSDSTLGSTQLTSSLSFSVSPFRNVCFLKKGRARERYERSKKKNGKSKRGSNLGLQRERWIEIDFGWKKIRTHHRESRVCFSKRWRIGGESTAKLYWCRFGLPLLSNPRSSAGWSYAARAAANRILQVKIRTKRGNCTQRETCVSVLDTNLAKSEMNTFDKILHATTIPCQSPIF